MNRLRILRVTVAGVLTFAQVVIGGSAVLAQTITSAPESNLSVTNLKLSLVPSSAVARYADPQAGLTVDQAVAYALGP